MVVTGIMLFVLILSLLVCLHGMEYRCKTSQMRWGHPSYRQRLDAKAAIVAAIFDSLVPSSGRRCHRHGQEGFLLSISKPSPRSCQRPDVRITSAMMAAAVWLTVATSWATCLDDAQHYRRHHRGRPGPRGAPQTDLIDWRS